MQGEALRSNPFKYDANKHTPPPYNLPTGLIIFAPIIGGLIVAFLVQVTHGTVVTTSRRHDVTTSRRHDVTP